MSRPQSMPDFTALMDASTSKFEKRIHSRRQTSPERRADHLRKKPSVSLAAGLIMNNETPRSTRPLPSPLKQNRDETVTEGSEDYEECANLFYAYALRSDYPESPPYILTFASVTVCSLWWALVQQAFPESSRPSPQFFNIRSEHMVLLRDEPKFHSVHNKWFYTSQDSPTCPPTLIPVQSTSGGSVAPSQHAVEEKPATSALDRLTETLGKLASIVETNVEQIQALSMAQSAGLQHMQEINESNSTQIKAIADSQLRLQALVDQNASHYIALSNTTFQSNEQTRKSQEQTTKSQEQTRKGQEQTRDILKTTVSQLQTLSKNQVQLSQTCEGMMRSVESLSNSVSQMNTNSTMSDTASLHSAVSAASLNALAHRISPGPRKLNRSIKGVWYEYDDASALGLTSRKRVDSMATPPKSPVIFKNV